MRTPEMIKFSYRWGGYFSESKINDINSWYILYNVLFKRM